jgi:hypothetical protein
MMSGESHPLSIVVVGSGDWKQRQHDFLFKVSRSIRIISRFLGNQFD